MAAPEWMTGDWGRTNAAFAGCVFGVTISKNATHSGGYATKPGRNPPGIHGFFAAEYLLVRHPGERL